MRQLYLETIGYLTSYGRTYSMVLITGEEDGIEIGKL